MIIEEWRDIPGYEGLYQASNLGNIRNFNGKILKVRKGVGGYLYIMLYKEGKRKNWRVHRLIALTWIPNPLNLPQINHRNECPWDNKVENLEYCTAKYNVNYGSHSKKQSESSRNRYDISKHIMQYSIDGTLIAEYPSLREAERKTGIRHQHISDSIIGVRQQKAGGYIWKFA